MAIKHVTTLGFYDDEFIATFGFTPNINVVVPCVGPRRRPDELMTYRTRMGADESLRRRVSSDESLRTRPPECGNES